MQYEIIQTPFGDLIKATSLDGIVSFIPKDPANSDYQKYLASLDEASTL
jgi:hypothetical protein